MRLAETVKEKREEILKVAARRGAPTNVRLFGSPAGEERLLQVMWICWCSWRKDGAF